jgi:protease-4
VWRFLRRGLSLALLSVSEWILILLGRRRPYGILHLDIGGELAEESSEQRVLGVLRRPATDYLSLISLLRWAREDKRLKAVLVHCDDLHASWARVQGLRRALTRLRESGKQVWVHLEHAGIYEYYLALAAERISLTPAGSLDVTGVSSEAVFFLDTLKKVGVEADIIQIGRYKAAGEAFTRRDMSPAHREMMESLVDDLYGQMVDAIAAGRGLEPGAAREIVDRGPFLAAEAGTLGLVDEVVYGDEIQERAKQICGGAEVIERTAYATRRGREMRREVLRRGRGVLAVLHINGAIKRGDSIPGPEGANAVGSKSIAGALKDLRERDDVRGIVLRVTSPGGSGAGSDLIWRELVRTRETKPVVVSCGDVAASGGYYVAVAGSPVFAEAGTITGSIGVIAGKASLRGLYDRLGISKELVTRGRHAALHSDYAPLGDEQRARVRAEAETFYRDFVDKVAAARRLSPEAVAAAAEGRVWTGRQAWTRGLVDELGGLEEALAAAKALAAIATDEAVAVERFPKPRRLWKLAVDLNLPRQGGIGHLIDSLPALRFIWRERLWAVLPVQLRFF